MDIHLFIRTPIGLVPCLNFLSYLAIHISLLFIRDLFVDLYVGALVTPHCVTKKVRTPPPPPIPHPPFIPSLQNMTLLSIPYKLEEGKEGIGKIRGK